MSKSIDFRLAHRTVWVSFLNPEPTEAEILEEAKTMKNGRAYLFQDNKDKSYSLRWQRKNPNPKYYTFIKTIL